MMMSITYKKFGQYEEQWVAVDTKTEEILDADQDIGKLKKRLDRSPKKEDEFLVFFVNKFNAFFAG